MNNPILDELAGLSPAAKAALAQAHTAMAGATSTPAAAPAPLKPPQQPAPALGRPVGPQTVGPNLIPPTPAMPQQANAGPGPRGLGGNPYEAAPALPSSARSDAPTIGLPAPTVRSPLEQQTSQDMERLGHLKDTGSGISQIHSRIENSTFGQNHPTLGKVLGWGAEIPARLADIAGSVVAPAIDARIPGTEMHHQTLLNQTTKQVGADEANAQREAATEHEKEETAELPAKAKSEEDLRQAQIGNLNSEAEARKEPDLAKAYAHAVNQAITNGQDPAQDPIVQHLGDAITSLQKQPAPKGKQHVALIGPNGKPTAGTFDEETGKYFDAAGKEITNPVLYERPTNVNVNAEHKEKGEVLKIYQPTLDSAERMNVMTENYEKAIKDHDQQAMLSLLANHLGMTMGLQKGARLTRDIIKEAEQSTPWLQGMKAKWDSDGYLTGVTLTPEQMRQMVGLGQSRYAEDAKKSRAAAGYLGVTDDGPVRTPGKATMRYYLAQTNGDVNKAKQLAADDGWTVK